MMMRLALTLLPALALTAARMAYQLPAGVELLLQGRSVAETFSCEGRPYGYYADLDNDCRLFHVCLPVPDAGGAVAEMAHFTFACGNATRFSQETLTCAGEGDAFPCEESAGLYDVVNARFGLLPEDGPRARSREAAREGPTRPPKDGPEDTTEAAPEQEEEEDASG